MKNLLPITFLIILPTLVFSQNYDRHIISPSGNHYVGSNGEMSWTIGEPLVMSFSNSTDLFTQGYQQPLLPSNIIITSIDDGAKILTTVYPNPTVSGISVQLSEKVDDVQLDLFSINGTKQRSWSFSGSTNIDLDLSSFPSGNYILRLTSSDYSTSIQIQKLN